MKGNTSTSKKVYIGLVLVPVVLLSGCKPLDWIKGKMGGQKANPAAQVKQVGAAAVVAGTPGEVPAGMFAVWGDGTAMVTEKDFNDKLNMFMKERPELKEMSQAFMPVLKSQILTALLYNKIIGKWIKESGKDKSAEYMTMLNQVIENIKDRINAEFFARAHEVVVADKDKKDYYEKNKDRFLGTRGGVKSSGIKFADKAKADAFATKAKAKGADFAKLAKADKLEVEDFDFVNDQTRGMDEALVGKIVKMKVPAVTVFEIADKDGKKIFWAVKATEKQKTSYKKYEEVEATIDAQLKQTEQGKALQKKLDELKTKYGVKVNEKAFAPPKMPMVPQMAPPAPKGKRPAGKKVADAQDSQPNLPLRKAKVA